jgi:peptide/nickel transport system permease protein
MDTFFAKIRYLKKFSLLGKLSLFIIFLIILIAILAPVFSQYPPDKSMAALQPPQKKHLMGTDDLGYDIWSQIAYGARISLVIGLGTSRNNSSF